MSPTRTGGAQKEKKLPPKSTETSSPESTSAWGHVFPVLVALLTVGAFLPFLYNDFVNWDDYETLVNNPHYRGLGWRQLRWMFTTFHTGHYQPLSWMTFGLNYLVSGLDPFGYHLTNLFLHVANAVLFYYVGRRLLSLTMAAPVPTDAQCWLAALAALLFSLHPLRVESVAWATERRDVLSAFFFLAAIYCYLRRQSSLHDKIRRGWLTLAMIAYALSLLAKATGITLPAVLLLLDFYPLRRFQSRATPRLIADLRQAVWEKLPFFFLAFVFALTALFAQQSAGALRPIEQYYGFYRLAQAFYGLCFYLWKSLWPTQLSPLYELPFDFDAWIPLFLLCGAMIAFFTLVVLLLRGRYPALLASWAYYVLLLAPVLGVAQSGPQLVADRYTYLSCLSWALLAAGSIGHFTCRAIQKKPEWRAGLVVVPILAVSIVTVYGILTWRQVFVWRNTKVLWQHVLAVAPQTSIARYNFGRILEDEGKIAESIEYYRRAITTNPAYADAHYNLARLLAKGGMQSEAIAHYRQVLILRPTDADAHNNLGLLYGLRGQFEAALAELRAAIQIDPTHARAFYNLGRIYARKGDIDKAVPHFQTALVLSPDEAEIHLALGDTLLRQGRPNAATTHFRQAIKLKPGAADGYIALARSLAAEGKKDDAEKQYQQALRLLKSEQKNTSSR